MILVFLYFRMSQEDRLVETEEAPIAIVATVPHVELAPHSTVSRDWVC